jgi:hypothetical protein
MWSNDDDVHRATVTNPSAPTMARAYPTGAGQRRLSTTPLPVTPGSAAVVAAVLVLAAMVTAGFHPRARLGGLG